MMTYFPWLSSYEVNVREIDEQHKLLVDMINALHSALVGENGTATQKAILLQMAEYADVHFATEEKYMLQFAYPDFPAHKAEHDKFLLATSSLKERFQQGNAVLTMEILIFLKNWLQLHILGTDMRFSKFFNEHGLH